MVVLKKLVMASVAGLVLISLPACSQESKGTTVLKVNDSVITKPVLDRTVKTLLARDGVKQPTQEQLKKASDAALEQLTFAELLYQEGKKLQIKDLDQMVETNYQKNRAGFPTQAAYEEALKSNGMSDKEVREAMRKEIVVNHFVEQQFFQKASVSDEEVRKFYDDNKDKLFNKGERLSASHILVSVDQKGAPQDKQKAKEKAEALLKRVNTGEDFATVATKESTCPSRAVGGKLGVFGKGQMVPPFEKAAYALKKGEISPVVESEFGYHIIKLDDRIPQGSEKFEDNKEKIVQFLKQQKTRQAAVDYVAQLRSKAKIEKK